MPAVRNADDESAAGHGPPGEDNPPSPRASLHALGCRLNIAETDHIRRQLEADGYEIVPWGAPADVCVLNTCTVTAQAGAKSRQALRAVRRRNPQAILAVTGCYAQTDTERLAALGLADVVVGNGEKLNLPHHLQPTPPLPGGARVTRIVAPRIPRGPFAVAGFDGGTLVTSGSGTRAHLKVQDGCDFMCTFCIIPTARGRARPRAFDNLMAEAETLACAGVRELVLTGVNPGTYAHGGRGLDGVVDALNEVPGLARIRISSIEPTTVACGLLERMADPAHRLVPFLHLPLQSGSARILTAMRRRYGPGAYRAFAEQALGAVPGLCLGTDVMVGFPGEDDAAFGETCALLEALPFAYLHVFPYSERAGTPAPRLPGNVPAPIRQRRAALLRALGDVKRRTFHRRFLGGTLPVLFEQPKHPGLAQGYTENYIRVEAAAADAEALRNQIRPVRLLEAGTAKVAGVLVGEIAEERCAGSGDPATQSSVISMGNVLE
ncbi:MAG: tRNA (N(6)-L-threonylcarbamoyladenosine(37)-C(2))-methylthiotransferase MtaB [SAR324 cluster bacterium]|nr:tRNA (N(6)-L-threonylcarbamoyladenosine(37)-C(2))-methylthiotransferase MtaB [SAR324 cluster bacterium]